MSDAETIECDLHGNAFMTFLCSHLAENPNQTWYSVTPSAENEWPDSWCSVCQIAYLRENQWNEKNEDAIKVKLFCHHCYAAHRALGRCTDVPAYDISE